MRITLKKHNFSKLLYSFLFFLYIFQPPLSSITLVYILDIIFFIIIILNRGRNLKIKVNSISKRVFVGFLPFIIYFIIFMSIKIILSEGILETNAYFENIRRVILTVIHLFISISFLLSIKNKNNYTINDIMDIYITASILQLICVLISFVVPSVKVFFNELIIANSKSDAIVNALTSFGSFRGYGFAENLFDQFGYVFSMLTVVILIEGIERRKTSLELLSFIMLIGSLLNTRTGLLLSVIGIILILMMYLGRMNAKLILKGTFIATIIIIIAYFIVGSMSDTAFIWVSNGIKEIKSLLFEKKTIGTFYYLSQDVILPKDIFFGVGGAPRSFSFVGIDIGYIQSIWMYGLFGTVLLFLGYISLLYKLYKTSNGKRGKCIAICYAFIFFMYMIKMFSCYYPGSNFILFGIPILLMIEQQKEKLQLMSL